MFKLETFLCYQEHFGVIRKFWWYWKHFCVIKNILVLSGIFWRCQSPFVVVAKLINWSNMQNVFFATYWIFSSHYWEVFIWNAACKRLYWCRSFQSWLLEEEVKINERLESFFYVNNLPSTRHGVVFWEVNIGWTWIPVSKLIFSERHKLSWRSEQLMRKE